MSNSPLVSYVCLSPNKTSPRNHVIDTITIHCVVGQLSAESIGSCFDKRSANASCNYGIGKDGRIVMCVEEKDRSWCSSNAANDHRAITIECASDKKDPYAINSDVYRSLIELCTDICRRNHIPELRWKADKSLIGHPEQQNMTVHCWFKNKTCPGPYIYNRLGQIAREVNERLKNEIVVNSDEKIKMNFKVRVSIPNLNIRTGPGTVYKKTGTYTGIGTFTIDDVKKGSGSEKGWGHLVSDAGWISLDFAKRI